ncbi:hypothetical protein [Paracoccus isoporae]|uniref:hypothetical protein n=1 Tax=Paracoccus isoporae TaxID=591205 RepID=UPI00115F7FDE|nr:hypothetical protein [Paracoccus isoporae]
MKRHIEIWLRLVTAFPINAMSAHVVEASGTGDAGADLHLAVVHSADPHLTMHVAARGFFPGGLRTTRPGAHLIR